MNAMGVPFVETWATPAAGRRDTLFASCPHSAADGAQRFGETLGQSAKLKISSPRANAYNATSKRML